MPNLSVIKDFLRHLNFKLCINIYLNSLTMFYTHKDSYLKMNLKIYFSKSFCICHIWEMFGRKNWVKANIIVYKFFIKLSILACLVTKLFFLSLPPLPSPPQFHRLVFLLPSLLFLLIESNFIAIEK